MHDRMERKKGGGKCWCWRSEYGGIGESASGWIAVCSFGFVVGQNTIGLFLLSEAVTPLDFDMHRKTYICHRRHKMDKWIMTNRFD